MSNLNNISGIGIITTTHYFRYIEWNVVKRDNAQKQGLGVKHSIPLLVEIISGVKGRGSGGGVA